MRFAILAATMSAAITVPTAGIAQVPGSQGSDGTGTGGIALELNKLETVKSACRAYLVVQNHTGSALTALKLDLVMFGSDSVIERRLAVETAPLSAGKTAVRLFDMEGTACAGISRVLLNDVLACRDADGDRGECLSEIKTSSRAEAEFIR